MEAPLSDGECAWTDRSDDDEGNDDADDGDDDHKGAAAELVSSTPGEHSHVSLSLASSDYSLKDAHDNYESMLALAKRPGSGIDRGTVMFLEQKLHAVGKALHSLEKSSGELAVFQGMQADRKKTQEKLKQLQDAVAEVDKASACTFI